MTTQELFDLTANDIATRIHNSCGLTQFAKERAKFEGWLKVELIDILVHNGFNDALPEKRWTDVSFDEDKVGIELKTLNTNFRFPDVTLKIKPITDNIDGVNKDIKKLKNTDFKDKFVIFIVFPTTHDKKRWKVQLDRITCNLENNTYLREFTFGNGIPGVIYYGKVL